MNETCFFEFVDISNNEKCLVKFRLFNEQYPNSVAKFKKILIADNNIHLSFKKSKITRIVSPEFLVQFGLPVKRSGAKIVEFLSRAENKLVDPTELNNQLNNSYAFKNRKGLLCLVQSDNAIDSNSMELFVTLVRFNDYSELKNYLIIGECYNLKNYKQLLNFTKNKTVNLKDEPVDEILVSRCGLLIKDRKKENADDDNDENTVKAVDLLFKKRRRH